MISVAEQFGNLRETLGSILGIFTIMRWIRTLIAKITGRPPPADAISLTPDAFARFQGKSSPNGAGAPGAPPKASRKPLLFFIIAAFGIPYLMSKFIRTLAASQEEEERKRLAANGGQQLERIDPSQLEYCRVLYDYAPQSQPGGAGGVDLEVKKGDFVAVLSKTDPFGAPSEWWRCRTRDARMGYLPSTYLEVIRRHADMQQPKQPVAAIKATAEASDSSRANSLTNSLASSGVTSSSLQTPPTPVSVGRPGVNSLPEKGFGMGQPLTVDDFQKSQFYT
jgi:peroxin-13